MNYDVLHLQLCIRFLQEDHSLQIILCHLSNCNDKLEWNFLWNLDSTVDSLIHLTHRSFFQHSIFIDSHYNYFLVRQRYEIPKNVQCLNIMNEEIYAPSILFMYSHKKTLEFKQQRCISYERNESSMIVGMLISRSKRFVVKTVQWKIP